MCWLTATLPGLVTLFCNLVRLMVVNFRMTILRTCLSLFILNLLAASTGSRTRLQAVRIQAEDNLVDAAIAKPLDDSDISADILDIGAIAGTTQGVLGMAIQKSGRTTEYTTGTIEQVDVTVNVQYGGGQVGRFTEQILAGPMSQGGDSGSAVLDNDNNLVGLLFAGSDTTTIINRMENVFSALDLSL